MKDYSKEIIEIDGKEYTLFLNRKGIVAYEKYVREERQKLIDIQEEIKKYDSDKTIYVVEDNTNPFEDDNIKKTDEIFEQTSEINTIIYQKLYWIMLYENHKLSLTEVKELYKKALEEYGEEQLLELAEQMIEDANTNKIENVKNLKALRPKK